MRLVRVFVAHEFLGVAGYRGMAGTGGLAGGDGENPTLEHRAPNRDVIQLHRLDGKGVLFEDREVGDLAGSDAAEFVLLLPRIRRFDGDGAQGVFHADTLLGAGHAAGGRDAIDRAPDEIEGGAGAHRQVGVEGEGDVVLQDRGAAHHGIGALLGQDQTSPYLSAKPTG